MSASSKKKLRKEQNAAAMTEKQQKELKEAKKLKSMTLTFAVIMVLVVAIVVGVVVRSPIAGAIDRGTHAATVGTHELTTTDLSYFYIDAVNTYTQNVYSQYYSMLGDYWYLGLGFSTTTPLDEQEYKNEAEGEEDIATWADYFMNEAFESAKSVYGLYDKAVAENHKLTEDQQKALTNLEDSLELTALYSGYSSAASYLRGTYGDGANMKTYSKYYEISALASSYYQEYAESLEYEDKDYRDHEKGKFNDYSSFSYAIYQIKVDNYLPKTTTSTEKDSKATETTGPPTTSASSKKEPTKEELAAALEKAKADADKLASGEYKDSKAFDLAIQALEINKGDKKVASTVSENVFYGNISNSDIKKWVGNANRKEGDVTVIAITQKDSSDKENPTLKTTGYYVVYFMERDDNKTDLVDVRHILVKFEGGTKDKDGKVTYSEAEKNKAKEAAEKLLSDWKAGEATEESFGKLADEKTQDTGSKGKGGLYEKVYPGQMVEAFNDWCFNAERKTGDTGIVETEYGYHVMFFSKTQDITYRDSMIKAELVSEDAKEWHDAIQEAVKVTKVNLDGMEWDLVVG